MGLDQLYILDFILSNIQCGTWIAFLFILTDSLQHGKKHTRYTLKDIVLSVSLDQRYNVCPRTWTPFIEWLGLRDNVVPHLDCFH